jgi:hypothetical protein
MGKACAVACWRRGVGGPWRLRGVGGPSSDSCRPPPAGARAQVRRSGGCTCAWPEFCDSQKYALPPTRMAVVLQQQGQQPAAAGAGGGSLAGTAGPGGEWVDPELVANLTGAAAAATAAAAVPAARGGGGQRAGAGAPEAAPGGGGGGAGATHQQAAGGACDGPGPSSGSAQASASGGQGCAGAGAAAGQPGAQGAPQEQSAAEAAARKLEALHVHQVYDAIATHFSSTRFAVWPKVGRRGREGGRLCGGWWMFCGTRCRLGAQRRPADWAAVAVASGMDSCLP